MPKIVRGEVRLNLTEIFAVFLREKFFEGSWEKQLEWMKENGSLQQKNEDIPLILALRDFELMHNINLRDFLPLDWRNFEPPKELAKILK